ncbi:transcription initiation factor IIA subunit 1 isoform X2 [Poeciliopsis prolifica]|uniref:transcription initiation factor IIA subunit 1 isoform X2 n=1 Tax=Poeciliopsis prolifica TaxID=188132 RepID=UPI0024135676|nr:transcription initiation factor IIA subunit 1 isoform X2 [Poeciliopsis prolifica]
MIHPYVHPGCASQLGRNPRLYRGVIEDVINEVRELFLDEGVDEQVLLELKTLWENKLLQSKAVEGFHTDEQASLQATQQQVQHVPQVQQVTQPTQAQQVILPPQQQQATPQQVIVQDPKILQHMSATGMSAAATAATLALPTGVTPYQQIITSQGQILQVVRAPNGTQYIIQQSQQPIVLQQPMQPGGVQAPVIQQVLAPLQGGLPQQTGVIIQPQQIVLASGNKVQGNTQVVQAATMVQQPGQAAMAAAAAAGGAAAAAQIQQVQQVQQAQGAAAPQAPPQAPQQSQPQPQAQQPPMMLQVDGAGDTSSEEDEDEEEEYDEDEEEEKDKDGGEDGQVEEEPLNSEDDVSEDEDQELFDTENVVVCQYDKIHRSKTKWKFHLKDGIMNLNGRDFVFSKATGDAEW